MQGMEFRTPIQGVRPRDDPLEGPNPLKKQRLGSSPLYKGYKATCLLFGGLRASKESTYGVYFFYKGYVAVQ